jgi:hypothetical protein
LQIIGNTQNFYRKTKIYSINLAEIAKYIAKKKKERQETKLILATKKPDLFLRETTNKKKAVIKKPEHFKNEN